MTKSARVRGWLGFIALLAVALPLVAAAVPDRVRIPMAKPHPAGAPAAAGLFSHWQHGSYRCYACHPSVFPQAPTAFTHAAMNSGAFCGQCHDGREAKAVNQMRCESCHVPR